MDKKGPSRWKWTEIHRKIWLLILIGFGVFILWEINAIAFENEGSTLSGVLFIDYLAIIAFGIIIIKEFFFPDIEKYL